MPRHFIDLDQLLRPELERLLALGHAMKKAGRALPEGISPDLAKGRALIMIFERPSTRTRVSFDVGMRQLGGETIVINQQDLQLGRGETIADTARVLSRYGDLIMARTRSHGTVAELAAHSSIPVINGLTNKSHPCQIMADLMTIEERLGAASKQTIAWVGDGNNVAASFIHAAVRFGFKLRLACPPSLQPSPELLEFAAKEGGKVDLMDDPKRAVKGADVVVTDTWVSMGDENADERKALLRPYQVDNALMKLAAPHAIFLHDLPAYRGNEVTAEVIDGPQSAVFDEAENRVHAQKAILAWCLGA